MITYLAKILGKTFYKTTPKRPIPVRLMPFKPKHKNNAAIPSTKPWKDSSETKAVAAPLQVAKEIERTLSTAQLNLIPSTTTSVKVGLASLTAGELAANIEAVIARLTDGLIAWRNIKAVHVKGPNTMALPIWLADELWTDEGMILEDEQVEEAKLLEAQKGKKRRTALEAPAGEAMQGPSEKKKKKRKGIDGIEQDAGTVSKKAKKLADDGLSEEMKERREKLRQQKKETREKLERELVEGIKSEKDEDVKKPSKKERRLKKAVEAV